MLFKYKKIILIVLATIFSIVIAINIISAKSVSIVRDLAANQKTLQGKLSLTDVEASWSGNIVFKNILWVAPNGTTVAQIPRVIVNFNLLDGLSGKIGVNSIKDITVENAVFNLTYTHKLGLDIVQLINFENLEKDDKTKKTSTNREPFAGKFTVKKSNLNLNFEDKQFKFNELNFFADLTKNPLLLAKLEIKEKDTHFDIDFNFTPEKTTIKGTAKNIVATDVMAVLPPIGNIKIVSGKIPSTNFIAERQQKIWQLTMQGNVENLSGSALDYKLDSINGSFNLNNQSLKLNNFNLNLENQAIKLDGQVNLQPTPAYDLVANAPNFYISALSPSLAMSEPVAIAAKISGALDAPKVDGTFSLASVTFEPLTLTNVHGNFNYFNTVLNITNAQAQAFNGVVYAAGNIYLVPKTFSFNVSGENLDSTQATGTQIKGPLQFSLTTSGTAEASSANAQGSFAIYDGDFAGIPFNSLQGDFTRANEKMNFSNIIIKTFAGTFNSSAIQDAAGKIKFNKLDLVFQKNDFSEQKEALKAEINTKLKNKLKSIF